MLTSDPPRKRLRRKTKQPEAYQPLQVPILSEPTAGLNDCRSVLPARPSGSAHNSEANVCSAERGASLPAAHVSAREPREGLASTVVKTSVSSASSSSAVLSKAPSPAMCLTRPVDAMTHGAIGKADEQKMELDAATEASSTLQPGTSITVPDAEGVAASLATPEKSAGRGEIKRQASDTSSNADMRIRPIASPFSSSRSSTPPSLCTAEPSAASEMTEADQSRREQPISKAAALAAAANLPGPKAQHDRKAKGKSGFLRLSSACSPSMKVERLVYLEKDEITFGRLPTSTVVLESSRYPAMISRLHARMTRHSADGDSAVWVLHDNKSMNGVLLNDTPIGTEGLSLKHGDIITFGRRIVPPEFEFVFEDASTQAATAPSETIAPAEAVFAEHAQRIAELQQQLYAEREQRIARSQERAASQPGLDVADIQSELRCSICRDWVIHATTLECSHTFCGLCIEQWLGGQRKFWCPECRHEITRQPVRSHALEAITQKTVEHSGAESKAEYVDRVKNAEEIAAQLEKLHVDLESSMKAALEKGETFKQVDVHWPKKEKEAFQRGAEGFRGKTREMYCRFRGLTVQWVHSADDSKLNQALHNLGLQAYVSCEEDEIRKRLLMFVQYG